MTSANPASESAARFVLNMLRPYWRSLLGGLLCIVLGALLALAWPWVLRRAIDGIVEGSLQGLEQLPWLALAIVAIAAVEAGCRFAGRFLVISMSRRAEFDLRENLYDHLLGLDTAFYQRQRVGDLMARATNDLSAVRQLFGPGIQLLFSTLILFSASLAMMASISPSLTAGAALLLPTISLVFGFFRSRLERRFSQVQAQFATLNAQAEENLAGIRVVKAYAQEEAEIAAFRGASLAYVDRALAQVRLSAVLWPLMGMLAGLAAVMLLYVGGRAVIAGELTLGQYVQFGTYLGQLGWPMIALGWVMNLIQQGLASLSRVRELLSATPAVGPATRAVARWRSLDGPVEGLAVRFERVGLRLGERWVLRECSFEARPGALIGLVGLTGSGKSLLLALLTRLYDPTEGRILANGRDLREWPLAELRQAVGFVPQETLLFSATLRANVAFGLEDAPDEAIEAVVRASSLSQDLPRFPDGLSTLVGERGVTLSGGQKQRTALARALLRDPRLLVLDDALSAVDAETEVAILAALRVFMQGRTSIVATHRLSAVRQSDLILVIEDGRIAERGTHQELVSQGGLYARLDRRQRLETELGLEPTAGAEQPLERAHERPWSAGTASA